MAAPKKKKDKKRAQLAGPPEPQGGYDYLMYKS